VTAAVIDTNVVVSGLLAGQRGSPTALILDAMLGGRLAYLLSVDLLAEYRAVLVRPAIRRRHGLGDAEVDVILTELALNGTMHEPASSGEALADAADRHLWALLEHAGAAVLVTGDHALRRRAPEPGRVVSPREFLARLAGGAGARGPDPSAR
jgi:putative PIN family toxin of toxin-antitoxin system